VAAGEHDGTLATCQHPFLLGTELGQQPRRLKVGRHQRKRLLLAALAGAQLCDRSLVVGTASEVVAA
jgi:hypothetical protein